MLDRAPLLRPVISGLLVLVAWELAVRFELIVSFAIPPPSEILPQVVDGIVSGRLVLATGQTLRHLANGFAFATVIGIPVGMLMGRYVIVRAALRPTINFLRPLPSIAVLPVFILVFGMGAPTISATVAFAAGWVMLLNAVDAVTRIHETTIATARVFDVRGARFAARVLIPAALPQLLIGLRIALGIALVVSVVAEIMVGAAGLGAYIVTSQGALRPADAFAGVLMIGLLGHALFKIWDTLQRRFVPWLANAG